MPQILALHAADIGAGAEGAAFAGNDDGTDRIVEAQFGEILAQLLAHVPGQRVEFLRPIEHHLRHGAVHPQIDRH